MSDPCGYKNRIEMHQPVGPALSEYHRFTIEDRYRFTALVDVKRQFGAAAKGRRSCAKASCATLGGNKRSQVNSARRTLEGQTLPRKYCFFELWRFVHP